MVDSSGWLEYLSSGPNAQVFAGDNMKAEIARTGAVHEMTRMKGTAQKRRAMGLFVASEVKKYVAQNRCAAEFEAIVGQLRSAFNRPRLISARLVEAVDEPGGGAPRILFDIKTDSDRADFLASEERFFSHMRKSVSTLYPFIAVMRDL